MNGKFKKILSLVIVMIMVISSVPMTSFAANVLCSAIGHSYEWLVTTEATCAVSGVETYTCTRSGCGETNGTREIPTVAHSDSDSDSYCDLCNTAVSATGRCGKTCNYVLYSDGQLIISGEGAIAAEAFYQKTDIGRVIISDGITEIGIDSFNSSSIKSIDISDSVTSIGSSAFYNCNNLTSIVIPDSVTTIGSYAFACCSSLISIDIPDSVTSIGEWTFAYCYSLTSVDIGDSVTTIGSYAFYNCYKLTSIDIPDSVTSIGNDAFEYCSSLTSVDIPDSVTSIGSYAFQYCSNLTSVDIGDSVTSIGIYAFCGCSNLTSVDIGDSVTTIGRSAFYKCSKLATVNIPVSVKYINAQAFRYCSSLYDVYYAGSEDDWALITIGDYNTGLSNATIHYASEGHVHSWGEWVITTEATCIKDGVKTTKCLVCSETATEAIPATGHTYGEWTVVKTATCAAAGIEKATCSVCSKEVTRTTDRLAHKEKNIEAVPATCTTDGSTAGIECEVCGAKVKGLETVKALGHDYKDDAKLSVAATCTTPGKDYGVCSRCNDVKDTVVEALGHTEEIIKGTEPDCTQSGISDGKKCVTCGEITVEQATVEALGHELVVDASKSTAATCTTKGMDFLACSRCGYTEEIEIDAMGHKVTNNASWITTTEATCLKDGVKTANCATCGQSVTKTIPATGHTEVTYKPAQDATCTAVGYTESKYCSVCKTVTVPAEEIPATGHTCGEWTVVKTATCAAAGIEKATCTVCSKEVTRTIDRLAHTEVAIAAKAPTCTESGISAGKQCSVCAIIIEGCSVIAATGHTEVVVPGTPSACGVNGTTDAIYCSVCKVIIKESMRLAALDHIMIPDKVNSKAATCTTEGVKVEKCSREGCTYTEKTTLPASHSFSSYTETAATCTTEGKRVGYCSVCKSTVAEIISATGHIVKNNASWITITEATCLKDGVKSAPCSVCGEVATETIPAIGHAEVIITAKTPTCQEEGYTAGKYCSVCNKVIVPSITIPKFEHSYGEWTISKTPTCVENGIVIRVCTICLKGDSRDISAIGHIDGDSDDQCDLCETNLHNPSEDCSCDCHKDGIKKILFNFTLFFQRLFRLNKTCSCGAAHY